jgi:hypothetical protein
MSNVSRGRRTFRRAAVAAAAAAATCLTGLTGIQQANADGVSYVWDDYSNCAPLYGAPSTEPGMVVQECAANGTGFAMDCWTDNDGERWFYGQIYDTGSWLYVQARWVSDQITIGAC